MVSRLEVNGAHYPNRAQIFKWSKVNSKNLFQARSFSNDRWSSIILKVSMLCPLLCMICSPYWEQVFHETFYCTLQLSSHTPLSWFWCKEYHFWLPKFVEYQNLQLPAFTTCAKDSRGAFFSLAWDTIKGHRQMATLAWDKTNRMISQHQWRRSPIENYQ